MLQGKLSISNQLTASTLVDPGVTSDSASSLEKAPDTRSEPVAMQSTTVTYKTSTRNGEAGKKAADLVLTQNLYGM